MDGAFRIEPNIENINKFIHEGYNTTNQNGNLDSWLIQSSKNCKFSGIQDLMIQVEKKMFVDLNIRAADYLTYSNNMNVMDIMDENIKHKRKTIRVLKNKEYQYEDGFENINNPNQNYNKNNQNILTEIKVSKRFLYLNKFPDNTESLYAKNIFFLFIYYYLFSFFVLIKFK